MLLDEVDNPVEDPVGQPFLKGRRNGPVRQTDAHCLDNLKPNLKVRLLTTLYSDNITFQPSYNVGSS